MASLAQFNKLLSNTGSTAVLTPYLMDFLLKEQRELERKTKTRKDVTVADAKLTIDCMESRIAEFNHGRLADKGAVQAFHPSQIGRCLRSMWFDAFHAPMQPEPRADFLKRHLTFEFGTYIHVLLQNLCARAGVLEGREVVVQSDDPFVEGHCDGIVSINGVRYALEIKSINPRDFASLTEPKHEHLQQVTAYMMVLGLEFAIVLYVNKADSSVREYVVSFDREFAREHVYGRILRFQTCVRYGILPARETEGAGKAPCIYCRYSGLCYDSVALAHFRKTLT